MNKQRTMNMFAETSEDLPIISGMARTQAAEMPVTHIVLVPDGYDLVGHYEGCDIRITRVESGDYNVSVYAKFWSFSDVHFDTVSACETWAKIKCEYIKQQRR